MSMLPFDRLVQPIWEVAPYPIFVSGYDPIPRDRKILYVNSAFVELTGYAREEAVGQSASLLDGPATDTAEIEACEAALALGDPYEYAALHYRKDGSEYPSRVSTAPLHEPEGSPEFLISIEMKISPHEFARRSGRMADASAFVPLTLPMPLQEFPSGELPRHLASHPKLDQLRALWTRLCGHRRMPRRSDFSLDVVKQWASHLSITTVTPDGRFQFRLFGTELVSVYGRDLTGAFLDELTPTDLWSVVILHYRTVAGTGQPLFAPVSIANGRWYTEVSRLLLPLSNDGTRVDFIMGADYSRSEI